LVVLLLGFGQIAKAGDLAPGKYRIASAIQDAKPRCIDKATQDDSTIQIYYCDGGSQQVFTVSSAPDGNFYIFDHNSHALGLGEGREGDDFVNQVFSAGTPFTPTVKPATWQFQRNTGDRNFAILCESNCQGYHGAVQTGCIDRRDPSKSGLVQVANCNGILGQQWIISSGSASFSVGPERFSAMIQSLAAVLRGLVLSLAGEKGQ